MDEQTEKGFLAGYWDYTPRLYSAVGRSLADSYQTATTIAARHGIATRLFLEMFIGMEAFGAWAYGLKHRGDVSPGFLSQFLRYDSNNLNSFLETAAAFATVEDVQAYLCLPDAEQVQAAMLASESFTDDSEHEGHIAESWTETWSYFARQLPILGRIWKDHPELKQLYNRTKHGMSFLRPAGGVDEATLHYVARSGEVATLAATAGVAEAFGHNIGTIAQALEKFAQVVWAMSESGVLYPAKSD